VGVLEYFMEFFTVAAPGVTTNFYDPPEKSSIFTAEVRGLESLKEHASEKERKNVEELITSSNKLLDTVKHAIILLQ
ncbi:hypothetical protein ANCDUO_25900, partial [Ancylostoma duodenale]